MTAIYLNQTTPRWMPTTEEAIRDAADAGLLEETHFLELKSDLKPGPAANKELARDLAQFAIDGGTLLVGVAETPEGPPTLSPIADVDGLCERIEQVARSIPDPPLSVVCTRIDRGDRSGYVVVQVPASARAPHMVAQVYFGRGDKTKIRLSDDEVRRLHAAQQTQRDIGRQEMARYVARDPVPTELRQQAHLYVVAVPTAPRPEMLLSLTHGPTAQQEQFALIYQAAQEPTGVSRFSPTLTDATSFHRRDDGAAMTSYGLAEGRILNSEAGAPFREDFIEVEFSEDGVIRLMTSRFSDEVRSGAGQELFGTMAPVLVRQFVELARAVSAKAGYGGMWSLGFAATKVKGIPVHLGGRTSWQWEAGGLTTDSFEHYTHEPTLELAQHPGPVTERLVGKFLRAAGISNSRDSQSSIA